jgi:hypothetical protein
MGHSYYKVGFLCLIGIAHLPEAMSKIRYYNTFELRPSISTNLKPSIDETLGNIPKHANIVISNLFSAIKMICNKVIDHLPISGNVDYEDEH